MGRSALPGHPGAPEHPAVQLGLTLRGDYAVRASLAIALLEDGRPVSARRIAERMDIPPGFLAHVLTDLVRAGIVVGTAGRNGGYRLAAPASAIDLLRVVDAVEARGDDPRRCVMRGGPCRLDGTCAVHDAFTAAAAAMRRELAAVNLSQLVADGLTLRRGVGTSSPS
jgi:Rrf2 family protein